MKKQKKVHDSQNEQNMNLTLMYVAICHTILVKLKDKRNTSVMDNNYFSLLIRENGFEGYMSNEPRSTMFLYSNKTYTPLAALQFHSNHSSSKCLLTARPQEKDSSVNTFQAIINRDNQVVLFSIVNLCPKGSINFNILRKPHYVDAVDPGPEYGINAVNEIDANQGYTIPCDQKTGREMIVTGRTKKTIQVKADGKTEEKVEKITVQEADQKQEGLFFYLSVVPSNSVPTLVDIFAEGTSWKCASYFVRKIPENYVDHSNNEPFPYQRFGSNIRNHIFNPVLERRTIIAAQEDEDEDEYSAHEADLEESGSVMYNQSVARGPIAPSIQPTSFQSIPRPLEESEPLSGSIIHETSRHERSNLNNSYSSAAPGSAGVNNIKCSRAMKKKSVDHGDGNDIDFKATQAAEISYGSSVKVATRSTGLEYAYEHQSSPTMLSVSIYPELVFSDLPAKKDMQEICRVEMKNWLDNQNELLIKSLDRVYRSETCVIDLESPADTIIVQCGHQCIHHSNIGNLKNCPVCRNPVTSFVRDSCM